MEEAKLLHALTPNANRIWEFTRQRGACFAEEIERSLGLSSIEVRYALWELAAAGLASADGFDQLRAMIDPDRRRSTNLAYRKVRSAAGRWSLFRCNAKAPKDAIEQARFNDIAVESAARMLLNRYGVVFRDLLELESNTPHWGILLRMFRRLEDRGEIRGGRFVNGFRGEQFALPEVLDSLRSAGDQQFKGEISLAGADPLNLVGILIPGERTPAVPGRTFTVTEQMLMGSSTSEAPEPTRWRSRIPPQRPRSSRAEIEGATLFQMPANA